MQQIIFDEKTLADVFKDIYHNTNSKREQINTFILKLVKMIHTADEAAILSPIIKDFMEVNVKNDEHIVRVAQIAQRAISIGEKVNTPDGLLTEDEKEQLLTNIKYDLEDLREDAQQVEDELELIRVK